MSTIIPQTNPTISKPTQKKEAPSTKQIVITKEVWGFLNWLKVELDNTFWVKFNNDNEVIYFLINYYYKK